MDKIKLILTVWLTFLYKLIIKKIVNSIVYINYNILIDILSRIKE